MKAAINGFGRIGRQVLRICLEDPEAPEIVHVNDIADPATLAHLLKYDSTYGVWDREVAANESSLIVDDREIRITAEKDPAKLPWRDEGVHVVLESSGVFRQREQAQQHIDAGAKKVLISAPGKSPLDGDFVIGVNDQEYDAAKHHIISIGSCTTNCLAPMAKVLHDEFTILRGLMTTVHAYTSSQNLLDGPHKDLRRARSAAENIIPTSTGAAETIAKVIPELQGTLDGMALRVSLACGSITDFTCVVEKETSIEHVNDAMHRYSQASMKGVLQLAPAPIVSRDVIGNTHSCVFSADDTFVKDGTLVKVLGWYDNEWGFSKRAVEMMARML
ncbi:MAG: type I glyceraldehyde-3-phosphate dehydrogenase [Planctomycetota bacterium]|nr:MAG: type I glyceraldehyde-3-phosphate dehydrogenase [Planctomycetota bacterium]